MRIGDLAQQTGASVRSLRYYEEQGLLSSVRTSNGQRTYDDHAVARVRLLRQLYNAGLTSSTIATLMPCVDSPSSATTEATIALMRREHDRLGEQVDDLVRTREQLAYLIDAAVACAQEPAAGSAAA
ncbi:MerR family transcriptional regulator [Microlunatus flavus]|uniref:DNA-binding transcriptional regulator, MerR family n=1 Tax=Microlunatus flavus TaxID=1036181 RepID=A0A1H9I317_9ACTN|nr:MerR family transcriptional regulator [Microlunatus flavus]SEQ68953.1 DNA-binding transcriptional regulator, MerR family [Microlunatus flavus]